MARVPVYGKLAFRDRTGQPAEKGINVGDEWTYRSFIEGGTLAAAVWSFQGITPERFPDGLPVEMTIEAFRTYKGGHRETGAGEPVGKKPGQRQEQARDGANLRIEGFRHRRAPRPARSGKPRTERRSTCSRTSSARTAGSRSG